MTTEQITMAGFKLALLGLLCPFMAHGETLAKPETPTYVAAACCTLCPRASDPKAYVTQFLRDHQVLLQGRDDWLFHSKVELEANFPIEPQVLADLGRLTPDRDEAGRRSPDISPLYADLRGMPPALFVAGDLDPLRDDSRLMAEAWPADGCVRALFFY